MVGSTNPNRFGQGFSSSAPQDWACSTAQLTLRRLCIDRRQMGNTAHKSGSEGTLKGNAYTSTRDWFYSTQGYITSPVSTSRPGNLHADPQHFAPGWGILSAVSAQLCFHRAVSPTPCTGRPSLPVLKGATILQTLAQPAVVLGASSSTSYSFTAQTLAGRIAFSVHNLHFIFSQYSA